MTDDQLNEAKRLITSGVPLRAVARQFKMSESTLRGILKRDALAQSPPKTAPESEPESKPESHSEPASLLPPGVADYLNQLDISRMQSEAEQRHRIDSYTAKLSRND